MIDDVVIPVSAVMTRQSDGSYAPSSVQQGAVSADIIAQLFLQVHEVRAGGAGYA